MAGPVGFFTCPARRWLAGPPRLADALEEAMTGGNGRIDVDLGGVSFCDCSGVNVLLAARERARQAGVVFVCVWPCRRVLSGCWS
jgi:anti-sigma B factor antagonist